MPVKIFDDHMTNKDNIVSMASIPSIDRVLQSREMQAPIAAYGRQITTMLLREVVANLRAQGVGGQDISADITISAIVKQTKRRLDDLAAPSLRPVLNLTGTVLHTNLGRAPLPTEAIEAMVCVSGQASSLEYDLAKGERGHRDDHIAGLVCQLTGAEAACVFNVCHTRAFASWSPPNLLSGNSPKAAATVSMFSAPRYRGGAGASSKLPSWGRMFF